MQKIIITPVEVAALLGVSESYGRKVIREIKKELGDKKRITYRDFAKHYDFTLEEVMEGISKQTKTAC